MKMKTLLLFSLLLSLALQPAITAANQDFDEVEALLKNMVEKEDFGDKGVADMESTEGDDPSKNMLFADEQLDEEDLTAMKDDASKFNDEAKEMEELPEDEDDELALEQKESIEQVLEDNEPFEVKTEEKADEDVTYEEEMTFKNKLFAKMEENTEDGEIEEYGREQEVDPENSDDAKEMEENGIIEDFEQLAEIERNSASIITRYAGMGYNLLEGNPEGDFNRGGVDPGIKSTRFIFKQTFSSSQTNTIFYRGQKMRVPDQVTFHQTQSCVKSSSTNAYSGQSSYKKELSLSVQAEGSYNGLLSSASFALSSGMKQASDVTKKSHSVIVQVTKTCNFAQARYKLPSALSGRSGFKLTDDFKAAVNHLPTTYSARAYTQFLNNWGTHILEEVNVGTRYIKRQKLSYSRVYSFMSQQNSGSITVSGSYGRASGSVSVDINTLNQRVNENTNFRTNTQEFTIGSQNVPLPIHIKIVPISIALSDKLWSSPSLRVIRLKKANMIKALNDYAANRQARIDADPAIKLTVQWPSGQYSLMQPRQGCPPGWSSGWRYQDNEDKRNANRWSPSNIGSFLRFDTGSNFRTHYCTKTHDLVSNGFSWPQGKYCIAQYGNRCPDHFYSGSIKWDDEDRRNRNRKQLPLPRGDYDSNTRTYYCCRSDGNPHSEVILPPTRPFVLYRYQGVCQKVKGMHVRNFYIHFDDEDSRNSNRCSGNHPDGSCSRDHDLYPCYYTPR